MDPSIRRTLSIDIESSLATPPPSEATKQGNSLILEIAQFVESGLVREGFRLFHNGGLPLLSRRRGNLWEEIVFANATAPTEFTVRFHLNHDGVGVIRSRFWRPSTRAPKAIATGDIGLLEPTPVKAIWSTTGHARTGEAILTILQEYVVPWFDLFDDPPRLKEALEESNVPMVDLSTATELMLAEFDVREARRFLRAKSERAWPPAIGHKQAGFDLDASRLDAITAYYRL